MEPISLSLLTLYAELAQQVASAAEDGTVVTTNIKGIAYLRLQRWVGSSRTIQHLGRADDPEVQERAAAAAREMQRRQERRRLVSLLAREIPTPLPMLAKVLDAMQSAGLFRRGAVLVGTAAYQCYPPIIGYRLDAASLMTQDADLATADLAISGEDAGESMLSILQRADPDFASVPGLDSRAPPARFRNRRGFVVDLLTPQRRRTDANPMPLAGLSAGAVPLQHLDWLMDNAIEAVVLHGAGVPVRIPEPARFAVHKLIVAQKRPASEIAKRTKDLVQAGQIMRALNETAPYALADALADARSRGRDGWARPIDRSLTEIERRAS